MITTLHILFAQASTVTGSIDKFLDFLGKILLLPATAMLIYAGLLFHEGKTREAVFALIGAFILATSIPLARALFSL